MNKQIYYYFLLLVTLSSQCADHQIDNVTFEQLYPHHFAHTQQQENAKNHKKSSDCRVAFFIGALFAARMLTADYSLLHRAAYYNSQRLARTCLWMGENPNTQNSEGITPLMEAAHAGNNDIAELLLEHHANPNLGNSKGETPLMFARTAEITNTLLQHNAAINDQSDDGATALLRAAQEGRRPVVEVLLHQDDDNAAEVDRANHAGQTPLLAAAEVGNTPIVRMLLEHRAAAGILSADGNTALMHAAHHPVGLTQLLLDNNGSPNMANNNGETPLMRATTAGNLPVAHLLLARGAHVNAQTVSGQTALTLATAQGRTKFLKLLLAHNANTEAQVFSENRRRQMLGQTALMIAIKTPYLRQSQNVQLLLNADANPRTQTIDGQTAFTIAARYWKFWSLQPMINKRHLSVKKLIMELDTEEPIPEVLAQLVTEYLL
jgi:ankyrin repeat protein